jgi:hypothetical protein
MDGISALIRRDTVKLDIVSLSSEYVHADTLISYFIFSRIKGNKWLFFSYPISHVLVILA